MLRYGQIHFLTVHGASNVNRDDIGQPKSVVFGGTPRLRISSQAIKRAARRSNPWHKALGESLGVRTLRFGDKVKQHLVKLGAEPDKALEVAKQVAGLFGATSGADGARIKQLAFISVEEQAAAFALAERVFKGDATIDVKKDRDALLGRIGGCVDISMFGRMFADSPQFNAEAAVQVGHATTTHRAVSESDFYTSLDDLANLDEESGAGAAFMGEMAYGSGIFYQYTCVNREKLVKNLGGDADLAATGLRALAEALATVCPSGKQASFASHARASFILLELGDQQPRSLISSFQRAVTGDDVLGASIKGLKDARDAMDRAYGPCSDHHVVMDVNAGVGTLAGIQDALAGGLE